MLKLATMRRKQKKAYLAWLDYVTTKDELTREEALNIIRGQLMMPAEEIDCGLIDKCLDHLQPDRATRTYPTKEPTWQRIMQTYQEKEANRRRKETRRKRRIARPGVAVALFLLLVLAAGSTMAYALGMDVWSHIVSWTEDILSIETRILDEPEPRTTLDSAIAPTARRIGFGRGDGFDRELERLGMYPRLPSWMPGDFEFESVLTSEWVPGYFSIFAVYRGENGKWFGIEVRKLSGDFYQGLEVEKVDENPMIYNYRNIEFTITKNYERHILTWNDPPYQLIINGDLSQDTLINMINSIDEENN